MRFGTRELLAVVVLVSSPVVVARLAGARSGTPAAITVDYPSAGSVFPPEFPPPTFQWRDPDPQAGWWRIEVAFADGSPPLRFKARGEPMRIGEIDARCVGAVPPELTPEQAAAHTWKPDQAGWEAIKRHSLRGPATLTIAGVRGRDATRILSRGQVTIRTSQDPAGAPIFYRDVALIPTATEKGVIKPLPSFAIGLIQWRLRNIGETRSRLVMENVPTCANCHSFSLDGKTFGMDVDGPQNDKGLYAVVPVQKHTSIRQQDVIRWSSAGSVRTAGCTSCPPRAARRG